MIYCDLAICDRRRSMPLRYGRSNARCCPDAVTRNILEKQFLLIMSQFKSQIVISSAKMHCCVSKIKFEKVRLWCRWGRPRRGSATRRASRSSCAALALELEIILGFTQIENDLLQVLIFKLLFLNFCVMSISIGSFNEPMVKLIMTKTRNWCHAESYQGHQIIRSQEVLKNYKMGMRSNAVKQIKNKTLSISTIQ